MEVGVVVDLVLRPRCVPGSVSAGAVLTGRSGRITLVDGSGDLLSCPSGC